MEGFERLLRLDPSLGTGDLIRGRLVYGVSVLVILLQIPNMFILYMTYGRINAQFAVLLLVCALLAGTVMSLRKWRNWQAYGAFFGVVILGGVATITILLKDSVLAGGISSSLLPLIAIGPIIVGLIADWRMVAAYTVAAAGILAWQFGISSATLAGLTASSVDILDPAGSGQYVLDSMRINHSQRLTQTSVALLLSAGLSAWFGSRLYATLDALDAAVKDARRAEADKGDFLARMSHEIRTPLNGIVAMSELLDMQELPDRSRRPAQIISEASQSLLSIVDDVLDHERLEAGRLEIMEEPFDLRRSLSGLLDLHRQAAHKKRLWLGLEWQEGLPERVVGDGGRIRQIVGNFISNALKFTESGGVRVVVRGELRGVGHTGARVRMNIVVQDTGPGIAEDELDGVFERYRQTGTGRRQGSKGTGLGLAIAKELAELMGGGVGATSELGKGSAFHVTLDLPVDEAVLDVPRDRVA